MTLDYPLNACNLLQSIYVLSIIAKQFSFFVHQSYKFMTERWLKLPRIYFLQN